MPGPVSDSYNPEWGTSAAGHEIRQQLERMHEVVSQILGGKPPLYILDLVNKDDLKERIGAVLTEKQWRMIRFALERAGESI